MRDHATYPSTLLTYLYTLMKEDEVAQGLLSAYLVAPLSLDQEQRPHRVAKHRPDPIRGLPQDLQLLHGRRRQCELGFRPVLSVAWRTRPVG